MNLNKVFSYNPRLVKPISLKRAGDLYLQYIFSHFDTRYIYGERRIKELTARQYEKLGIKDFKTWLSTEI